MAETPASAPARTAATAQRAAETAQRAADTAQRAVHVARKGAARATVPRHEALGRARAGELVAIGALAGFGALFAAVRAKRSAAIDLAITLKVQKRRFPWTGKLMSVVSWPGFPPQSRVIPPTIIGALWGLGFRLEAAFQVLAWGTGLLSTILKGLMRRPRPLPPQVRVVVAPLGGTSFPSGHVLTYVGTYGFLAYLANTLIRPAPLRALLLGGLGALLALVGPSRIYQGHHWPTDVLASYLVGTSYVIGLTELYRRLKPRHPSVPERVAEVAGIASEATVDRVVRAA
jgi:undecaprenyl-diphosphatase